MYLNYLIALYTAPAKKKNARKAVFGLFSGVEIPPPLWPRKKKNTFNSLNILLQGRLTTFVTDIFLNWADLGSKIYLKVRFIKTLN